MALQDLWLAIDNPCRQWNADYWSPPHQIADLHLFPRIDIGDYLFMQKGDHLFTKASKCCLLTPPLKDWHGRLPLHVKRWSPFHTDCKMLIIESPSPGSTGQSTPDQHKNCSCMILITLTKPSYLVLWKSVIFNSLKMVHKNVLK